MKNFVGQISIKFGGFYLNKMTLVQTVLPKISVEIRLSADIQKVKYRPIILVDRYLVGLIYTIKPGLVNRSPQ